MECPANTPASRATAACQHARGLRVGLYDETRCATVGYPARDRVVVASYESIGDRPAAYEEARRHRRRTASPAVSFLGWRPHPEPDAHPGRRGDIADVVRELSFATPLGGPFRPLVHLPGERKTRMAPPTDQIILHEPLMTARDVAALLSVPVSTVHEYSRRARQPLPSLRVGRHRRYYRSDVERWLAQLRMH